MPKHNVLRQSQSFRAIMKRTEEEQRRQRSTSPFSGTGMGPTVDGGMSFTPGMISNDALGAPTVPGIAGTEATGFEIGTTLAEVAGLDLEVPVGCSELLIAATATTLAVNPDVAANDLWLSVQVASTASTPVGTPLPAVSYATATAVLATSVTGLVPAATVRLSVLASATAALGADPDNSAAISAHITWRP